MERLTVNDLNKVCYDPWELCGMDNYCKKGCHEEGGCTKGCHILKMYRKLAEYEDLEEQNRLLKLPCEIKKGNTFYAIIKSKIIHLKIDDCKINPYCGGIDICCINTDNKCDYRWIHLPNKNIFLTREEAEAALKELEGKNGNAPTDT